MSHLVKEIHSTLLDDSYYRIDHPSGLTILVMPKAGYSSAYALFGTKYGSIDTRFKRSDEADFTEVPEGIAHFWSTSSLKARIWTPLPAMQNRRVRQCVYVV